MKFVSNTLLTITFFIIGFYSCTDNSTFEVDQNRLHYIDPNEVDHIILTCGRDSTMPVIRFKSNDLIDKINNAQRSVMIKGLSTRNLQIITNTADTTYLRLLGERFKWSKSGDWGYDLRLPKGFFDEVCNSNLNSEIYN